MTSDQLVARVREIATEDAATQRAERIAAAIRDSGDRRWVGVYEVTGDEVAILGCAGRVLRRTPDSPAARDSPRPSWRPAAR